MREKAKKIRRIPCVIAALFLCVFALFSFTITPASAEEPETGYLQTDIEDDLSNLNMLTYGYNAFGEHEMIRLTEFSYSDKEAYLQFYDLYVYIYNPTQKAIKENGGVTVNMAVAYNSKGLPSSYENVALTFCDKTDNKRFYKFKIQDDEKALAVARAYEKTYGERRYDVAGVQVTFENNIIRDTSVSWTYYYKGYARGLGAGAEAESTLTYRWQELDTIELEVQHTSNLIGEKVYSDSVMGGSSFLEGQFVASGDGTSISKQLNTVYFAIPEEYFTNYGGLQKIKAEWYEYLTKPIFVTSDQGAYDGLVNYLNVNIGEVEDDLKWRVFFDEIKIVHNGSVLIPELYPGAVTAETIIPDYMYTFGWTYNKRAAMEYKIEGPSSSILQSGLPVTTKLYSIGTKGYINQIDWLLHKSGVETKNDYRVSSDELQRYAEWYTKRFGGEKVLGKYSATLFEDEIQANRIKFLQSQEERRGYVKVEVDAGEKLDISLGGNVSRFEDLYTQIGIDDIEGETISLNPFTVFTKEEVESLTVNQFADRYYINATDKGKVYDYFNEAVKNGKRPVLYNFAVTDYFSSTARFDYDESIVGQDGYTISNQDGYVAQTEVFLNFDIISLTFRNASGEDTVIGVVADPIDIFPALAPPENLDPEAQEREKLINAIITAALIIIGIIVGIILLAIYAPQVLVKIVEVIAKIFTTIGGWIATGFRKLKDAIQDSKEKRKKKNASSKPKEKKSESSKPKQNQQSKSKKKNKKKTSK